MKINGYSQPIEAKGILSDLALGYLKKCIEDVEDLDFMFRRTDAKRILNTYRVEVKTLESLKEHDFGLYQELKAVNEIYRVMLRNNITHFIVEE